MTKQAKPKKSTENLGKGKVTPVQVAFIVDRYLCDNNFHTTRSMFRTEASSLLPKIQALEAPKSLLSLGEMLDEYICLKEQKVVLEQEKSRVEGLLQGMKDVMNAYNTTVGVSSPPIAGSASKSMVLVPQSNSNIGSSPGYTASRTPSMSSMPWISHSSFEHTNFSTPTSSVVSKNKRKGSRTAHDATPSAKRACSQIPRKPSAPMGSKMPLQSQNIKTNPGNAYQQSPSVQPASRNCSPSGDSAQQSSVGKCLFKQPSPTLQDNSPSPKTPPQAITSQVDKLISPVETSTIANSACSNTYQITPTNCPVMPSNTVTVSPSKHVAYYSIERSHYISCSPKKTNNKKAGTRDHVKGRLDFGASDVSTSSEMPMTVETPMPEPSGEEDLFSMDIPDFDIFGADFSLSDFLVDIDFDSEQGLSPATDTSGSPHGSGDGSSETNQFVVEHQSSFTEVLCEKDVNIQGSDSFGSVRSITQSIKITSPAKNQRSPSLDQENLIARNLFA